MVTKGGTKSSQYQMSLSKASESTVTMADETAPVEAEDPQALTGHGESLRALKRYGRAIDAFTDSLALRADHAPTLNARGVSLALVGRLDDASRTLTVPELQPRQPDALNDRGVALRQAGAPGQGAGRFRKP
jgi:Flp pilus assembly protein TadD